MTFIYTPPEPVAWLSKHGHMQGNHENLAPRHAAEYSTHVDWQLLFTESKLRSEVERVRRETIEECAKVMESPLNNYAKVIKELLK